MRVPVKVLRMGDEKTLRLGYMLLVGLLRWFYSCVLNRSVSVQQFAGLQSTLRILFKSAYRRRHSVDGTVYHDFLHNLRRYFTDMFSIGDLCSFDANIEAT